MTITAERVREVLAYDSATGALTWRVCLNARGRLGSVAGCIDSHGYRMIRIDGRIYRAHRLAWLHFYGAWPAREIDHRNGVRTDNRMANLRDVTNSVNRQNLRRAKANSTTGVLGVFRSGRKFIAKLRLEGREQYLGTFETSELAYAAYVAAKRELHPGSTL